MIAFTGCALPALGDKIDDLIRQAGNSGNDQERIALLYELRGLPGLEKEIQADLDKLLPHLERWVNDPELDYFSRPIHDHLDYDFGIAEDSPLYPITRLYRGRMLVWVTLESGGIIRYPERRQRYLGKAKREFEHAAEAFPDNRITQMYLGEPIPPERTFPPVADAPEWAAYQREGLERLTDIIEWWIDHRMRADGQYGGGWGDDCEMWRWWVPVLIGFESPKIVAAQSRFSEALMNQPHMRSGYTTHLYDVEHTAEDSSDVITPMMHLDPDNPLWRRRALRLAELMEQFWTGHNEQGHLQFKSTYFSVDQIDDNPARACDTVYHPRAVQPALLYWQRTGDERLTRLFSAWMDTWVDVTACSQRGKPAGVIPSAIHWPDGQVGGLGSDWWDPRNHGETSLYRWPSAMSMMAETLLLTYHMTGDDKYLEPIRTMAAIRLDALRDKTIDPPEGTAAWCGRHMTGIIGAAAKYRFLTGRSEFDDLLREERSPYARFRLEGDRAELTGALKANAEALRINFPGYTSEVRYTDRVLRFPWLFGKEAILSEPKPEIRQPNPRLLYSSVTGDPGDAGYFPLNAVRWLTPPRDIATLVTHAERRGFAAELFHFGAKPRALAAEFYLLVPGDYTMIVAPAEQGEPAHASRSEFTVTERRTRVPFELPPGVLMRIRVEPK